MLPRVRERERERDLFHFPSVLNRKGMSANIPSTLKNLSQCIIQKICKEPGSLKGPTQTQTRTKQQRLNQGCKHFPQMAQCFPAPCSTSLATDLSGAWRQIRTGHRHHGPMVMFTLPFAPSALFICGRAVCKHVTQCCSSSFVIWWRRCTQH